MNMLKAVSLSIVCALCLTSIPTYAATAELALELVSAYVDRGATANARPSLQAEVTFSEFSEDEDALISPLSLTLWADWALRSSRKTYERNEYYLVHRHQVGEVNLCVDYEISELFGWEDLTMGLGYGMYIYPSSSAKTDHEVYLITSYDTFLQPTLGLYYLFAGGEYCKKAWYLEAGVSHEFDIGDWLEKRDGLKVTVGADVGIQWWNSLSKEDYYDEDDEGEEELIRGLRSGFAYAKYYVKGDWSIAALDDLGISTSLSYFQRMRKDTLGELYKTKWVATVGIAKEF